MKPLILAALVLSASLVWTDTADAQRRGSRRSSRRRIGGNTRPTLSPLLNLLGRRGADFDNQFINRYRPQREFRSANNELRQSARNLQGQINRQQSTIGRQQLQLEGIVQGRSTRRQAATFGSKYSSQYFGTRYSRSGGR
jgi:hypothetical protein